MDSLIIGQARGARLIEGLPIDTLGVISLTWTLREQAEGELTVTSAQGSHCGEVDMSYVCLGEHQCVDLQSEGYLLREKIEYNNILIYALL